MIPDTQSVTFLKISKETKKSLSQKRKIRIKQKSWMFREELK